MRDSGKPVLTVKKLHKDFKEIKALGGIDMSIDKAGVYGFLGPNGAGKTTTFKLISALLSPTSGSVEICGVDPHGNTKKAMKHLGVLFDAPSYYPYLTGEENIEVFARWSGRKDKKRIRDLLSMVGLHSAMKRKVEGYSWGMKRRLGIAAALLDEPDLLLLDEPTNGLDPSGIADMRKLIPELAYSHNCAVLLSSHRMDEVDQICEKIMIINQGKIVASGAISELSSSQPLLEIVCEDAGRAKQLLSETLGVDRIEFLGAGRIRIEMKDFTSSEINKLLIESGIEVQQILEKRESLEEIFFRMTGSRSNDE